MTNLADPPLILFGAFDRHNLGDLLLGKVAAALMRPRGVVFAGLAERDLTAVGGERVRSIRNLAGEWGRLPADVLHVGGEILTCSLYEAAVMLQADDVAGHLTSRHEMDATAQQAWAAAELGMDQPIAYLLPQGVFRNQRAVGFLGAGGVGLSALPQGVREVVFRRLSSSGFVWVRDKVTHRVLESSGVSALLAPDPCETAAEILGGGILARAAIHATYPQGYLAVQFSADYGDDATLDAIGQSLLRIQRDQDVGIVFFRAGAAPWHDSLSVYSRLVSRTNGLDAVVCSASHVLDLCALLARSRGFVGSSLHGRIVAESFGRPAASLVRGDALRSKVGNYVDSWRSGLGGSVAQADCLAEAFHVALTVGEKRIRAVRRCSLLAIAAANRCRRALGLATPAVVTSIQA